MSKILMLVISILLFFSLLLNINLLYKQKDNKTSTQYFETTIKEVVDGDTVIAQNSIRMRLSNVEAPELEYCGGPEAKEQLKNLIEGKKVQILTTSEDTFNRSLVLIYINGVLVNKVLLAEGLTRYDGTPNQERDALREAYQQAVKDKLGIYGPPCRSEVPDTSQCVIKGNIDRHSNKKTYHLPGCSEYSRAIVEKDLGESWFCSEKEAKTAGYTKASNCPEK